MLETESLSDFSYIEFLLGCFFSQVENLGGQKQNKSKSSLLCILYYQGGFCFSGIYWGSEESIPSHSIKNITSCSTSLLKSLHKTTNLTAVLIFWIYISMGKKQSQDNFGGKILCIFLYLCIKTRS